MYIEDKDERLKMCIEFVKLVAMHDPHSEINEPSGYPEDSIDIQEWSVSVLERLSSEADDLLGKVCKVKPWI